MRRLVALALLLAIGCGGPGEGDEAILWSKPTVTAKYVIDITIVGKDPAALRDTVGVSGEEWEKQSHRTFAVDNGTAVRVVKRDGDQTVVKILEGDHGGETGWVEAKAVRSK